MTPVLPINYCDLENFDLSEEYPETKHPSFDDIIDLDNDPFKFNNFTRKETRL